MEQRQKSCTVQTVVIDSAKRDRNAFPSSANFAVPVSLLSNVRQVRLKNYAIFNSVYVVNSSNNTFTITVAAVDYTITLTVGNYTSSTLATELQTRLNATGAAVYTVTDNQSTFKYTIGATVSTQYNFAAASSAAKLLGFAASNVSGTSVTSSNAYAVCITPYYYLRINELQVNINAPYPTFTMIVNNVPSGSMLSYNGSYYQTVIDMGALRNINTLTVTLLDWNYNIVDLNGMDWIMIFEFEMQS